MVQIIPQKQGFGASFGAGLGEGVSQGMNTLTKQLQQHRQQKAFGDYLDEMPEELSSQEKMMYVMKGPGDNEMKKMAISGLAQFEKQQQDIISPQAATLVERAQKGSKPTAAEMSTLSEKEIRTVLRAQEVSGVTGAEEEKAYLGKNLKRYDELSTEAIAERGVMRTLDEMENMVLTGATDDIISNLVTEYDIGILKPFLQKPGSKAYMTGFKALFNDFKATFGARPTVYEAKIYEKGLPELLSPNDAKLASIYELRAIKEAKVAESEAYNQAYDELGFKESPIKIEKRAQQLSEDAKDQIYDDFRSKIDELTGGKLSSGPDFKGGNLKKVAQGTPVSKVTAEEIIKRAGGDLEKARKIANKAGYEF